MILNNTVILSVDEQKQIVEGIAKSVGAWYDVSYNGIFAVIKILPSSPL